MMHQDLMYFIESTLFGCVDGEIPLPFGSARVGSKLVRVLISLEQSLPLIHIVVDAIVSSLN